MGRRPARPIRRHETCAAPSPRPPKVRSCPTRSRFPHGRPTALEASIPADSPANAATCHRGDFRHRNATHWPISSRRDAAVAALAARYPGLVPVLYPDPFHALVRSISAQQINLRFASRIRQRLAHTLRTRGSRSATTSSTSSTPRRWRPRMSRSCAQLQLTTRRRARSSRPRAPQPPASCVAQIWSAWTTRRSSHT